jgi:hypothetical protein
VASLPGLDVDLLGCAVGGPDTASGKRSGTAVYDLRVTYWTLRSDPSSIV